MNLIRLLGLQRVMNELLYNQRALHEEAAANKLQGAWHTHQAREAGKLFRTNLAAQILLKQGSHNLQQVFNSLRSSSGIAAESAYPNSVLSGSERDDHDVTLYEQLRFTAYMCLVAAAQLHTILLTVLQVSAVRACACACSPEAAQTMHTPHPLPSLPRIVISACLEQRLACNFSVV